MGDEELLPKPQTDLPLPEKEIPAHLASQGETFRGYGKIFRSKFFWGFLILSAFAAFLIGGFYLGKNQNNNNSIEIPPRGPVFYEPTPDPTADWKTFEGDGFSFRYPSDLYIRNDNTSSDQYNQFLEKPNDINRIKFSVDVISNPQNLDLIVIANKKPVPYDRIKDTYEKISINGYEAIINRSELPCLGDCKEDEVDEKGTNVLIKGNKKIITFYISTFNKGGPTATENWLNQILSTFKFTQ